MKKSNLKKSIQDGFSELSPELFDSIMETVEKENLMPSKKNLQCKKVVQMLRTHKVLRENRNRCIRRSNGIFQSMQYLPVPAC